MKILKKITYNLIAISMTIAFFLSNPIQVLAAGTNCPYGICHNPIDTGLINDTTTFIFIACSIVLYAVGFFLVTNAELIQKKLPKDK
ncbi:hypothetical protein JW887_01095 [Candidatus Dojkabacteria bacterium]|nr:hypothetical protein [Candidatus Dojkabacteria bacterium]